MFYRIGICDDEYSICKEISQYVNNYFAECEDYADVYMWESGDSLIKDLEGGTVLDILFLDIELPDMNGISIGRYVREQLKDSALSIVYISYKTSYAMQLFNIHPYDFLIKPVRQQQVSDTISSLLQINNEDRRFYAYRVNKVINKVLVGDIVYLESERKHMRLVMTDGTSREYVGKIKEEINNLPEYFIQIGQSYIVNYRHMRECRPEYVIMDNGTKLSISRGYKADVTDKILKLGV